MPLTNLKKAPFPFFGGKSQAAPLVWALMGDVPHYVEPFAGSLAVLLNRPHPCNRPYFSETVNDLDGLLVNAWRAIQWSPEETACFASWPVSESDKHARAIALVRWREDRLAEKLAGSPEWHDPKMAGWWVWGVCCQIGAFAAGGPWTADDTGRIVKINRRAEGNGEPGVTRNLPHLSGDGMGVNRPGAREPGVTRNLPHLSDDGRGVNHAGTREPGVLSDAPENEFHPLTMPELTRWFCWLSARLRHVRILNGDWARLVTTGASKTLSVRQGDGPVGVFLDPPYADTATRATGLYASDDLQVSHRVAEWCLTHGHDPERRIVLAGYDGEHDAELVRAGWTEHEWFTKGHLRGGMGNLAKAKGDGHQQGRERLWASPACLRVCKQVPQGEFDWSSAEEEEDDYAEDEG